MKKTCLPLLLLLLLVALFTPAQAQNKTDKAPVKTENRPVTAFTTLSVRGGFEVVLTQGATESLTLEAEENVLPLVESKVQDGKLIIKLKENRNLKAKKLKAYVTVRSLQNLELSGGIKLSSTNTLNAAKLALEFAGSVNGQLALQVKELSGEFAGSHKLTFSGHADKARIEMAGASSLKALDLTTEHFTLEAAGSSNAQVNVSKSLSVDAAGIMNVEYKGSPTVKHSGMGKVRPL